MPSSKHASCECKVVTYILPSTHLHFKPNPTTQIKCLQSYNRNTTSKNKEKQKKIEHQMTSPEEMTFLNSHKLIVPSVISRCLITRRAGEYSPMKKKQTKWKEKKRVIFRTAFTLFIPISAQSARVSHFEWALIVSIICCKDQPQNLRFSPFSG